MSRKTLFVTFLIAISLIMLTVVSGAVEGSIEGVVTDPKGALIKEASVTAKNITTNQTFTAKTDSQGRYKIENVPAGTYIITIAAQGFSTFTKESVVVEEGKSTRIEAKLNIAPVDVGVDVKVTKPNDDPLYQQLRQQSKQQNMFTDEYAVVNNLVLKRDQATFTLTSGEIYFLPPIEGRNTGAVFIGSGEFYLLPTIPVEQRSLAMFTSTADIKEEFTNLVLRFTDKTFEEIKASPNVQIKTGGAQASDAKDAYKRREDDWRKTLKINLDQRTLMDVMKPQRKGFFTAFIKGKKYDNLLYRVDPIGLPVVAPEQVNLINYGESNFDIWVSYHMAEEYKRGTATNNQDRRLFDFTSHNIDVTIKGTRITATDKVTMIALTGSERVVPFDLFPELRVSNVRDENGNDLKFIQQERNEDADFAVILQEPTTPGKVITLTVDYDGDGAISHEGDGNFFPIARTNWYPSNSGGQFGDRATFDVTYRYSKAYTMIGVGNLVEEKTEKDTKIAKWTTGQTEMSVSGFNFGKFKKREVVDKDTGYGVEFYANEELPAGLKNLQQRIDIAESQGAVTGTTLGAITTTSMGSTALASAQNSVRIYNTYFGKLPYNRIAISQQPAGNFGQAWPTLIYMPFTAFLDDTIRTQLMGVKGGTDTFYKYVEPHEVAHEWWGHTVGWTSYRDQWMSEGFAEFSASLYVQFTEKDLSKYIDFWEDQRKMIVEPRPQTKDRKPYTVGPVTQGYRLNSSKTGYWIARFSIYPKGAYILHMLRRMMYDQKTSDQKFMAMMQDFISTYYNRDVSTEDFKKIVEKHMLPSMDIDGNKTMNWFFNEWVYGTEVPAYTFDYTVSKNAEGKTVFNGKITQSGVTDRFVMLVPLYLDFGKGWIKVGSSTVVGNSTAEIKDMILPQAPTKAAICVMNDVLATSIQNKKL